MNADDSSAVLLCVLEWLNAMQLQGPPKRAQGNFSDRNEQRSIQCAPDNIRVRGIAVMRMHRRQ